MAVSVNCPQCHASFPVSAELLGKKMRCRGCQAVFIGTASPAKVVAGAGGGTATVTRPDVAARPTTRPVAHAKSGDKSTMFAFIGIGTAVALMAAITVWALFLREGFGSSGTPDSGGGPVTKIKINESVKDETSVVKTDKDQLKEVTKSEPTRPKISVASFVDTPKNLPYRIEPMTEERVKKSAAWIKVGGDDGGGFGSGWVAEPGIVITNAHVVGMKDPSAPAPGFVRVIFDSGLKTERNFEAKILGLDRENDLCVLRIEGENLPDPIPIARSAEMVEGQHLYVVGFPRGNMVAKIFADDKTTLETTVKVRQSTVVGRMPTKTGSIKLVQIEGGADPGNSGSGIVDTGGHIRLIHVMGYGPALKFSIPSEYAVYLLQGRMLRLVPSQPAMIDGAVKQQLTGWVADPMKRIKAVALDLWVGNSSQRFRPPSETEPTPQSGDGPRVTVNMAYDPEQTVAIGASREAKGEWTMPELGDGQVYWVQPRYTGNDGKVRWGDAVILETAVLPVQRKPAMLAIRHKAGSKFKLQMESHIGISAAPEGGGLHLQNNGLKMDLTEKVLSVNPDGGAKVQFSYNEVRPTDEDTDYQYRELVRGLLESAKGMVTDMQVSKRGLIRSPNPVMKNVPLPIRPILERFNVQTIQSMEAVSLALPDRELKPGETWEHDQNYTVSFGRQLTENALFKMKYRYVGTRLRNDREEAVIEFTGTIVRGEGSEPIVVAHDPDAKAGKQGKDKNAPLRIRGMHGAVRGAALVDLTTGLTSLARTTGELEFEVPYVMQMLKFGAALRIDVQREITPGTIVKNPLQLLPNQEVSLSPFVGSPDHKLTQVPAAQP